jgi:hypothetical protein
MKSGTQSKTGAKVSKKHGKTPKKPREKAGRPPIYETPYQMQKKIKEYFDKGVRKRKLITQSGELIEIPTPTITGLCLYLGFDSRQSFFDYEHKEQFSYTIKKTRLMIEVEYEEQLRSGSVSGAIFALKNFGWIDKQTVVNENRQPMQVVITNDKQGEENKRILENFMKENPDDSN